MCNSAARMKCMRAACSVMKTLEIVGERWTLLVLREAFYGVRRFDEMRANVGCARNMLSDRLGTLVAHELLARVPYLEEGQRERLEYRLTEKGRALFPVIVALMEWGDRWTQARGAPVLLRHRGCGARVSTALRCAAGHTVDGAHAVEVELSRARPARSPRDRASASASPPPSPGPAGRRRRRSSASGSPTARSATRAHSGPSASRTAPRSPRR